MISFQVSADIKDDRQLLLDLPPQVPVGKAEVVVILEPQAEAPPKRRGTSLADWAEQNAEDWGDSLNSENVASFTGRRF
jgi:hypothetical protein